MTPSPALVAFREAAKVALAEGSCSDELVPIIDALDAEDERGERLSGTPARPTHDVLVNLLRMAADTSGEPLTQREGLFLTEVMRDHGIDPVQERIFLP